MTNICGYCGSHADDGESIIHFDNCARPRPDEMAAGLIHEPGTGGDETLGYGKFHPANLACIEKAGDTEPMFIILGRDPDAAFIVGLWADRREAAGDVLHADRVRPFVQAMKEWPLAADTAPDWDAYPPFGLARHPETDSTAEPPMFDEVDQAAPNGDNPHYMGPAARHDHAISEQKVNFLSNQVSSLISRLGAAYVAAGVMDPNAIPGFGIKEGAPINHVIAQIEQQEPQP